MSLLLYCVPPQDSIVQWCRGIYFMFLSTDISWTERWWVPQRAHYKTSKIPSHRLFQHIKPPVWRGSRKQEAILEEVRKHHSFLCPWLHQPVAVRWFGPRIDGLSPVCPFTGSLVVIVVVWPEDRPPSQVSWGTAEGQLGRCCWSPGQKHSSWNQEAPRMGPKPFRRSSLSCSAQLDCFCFAIICITHNSGVFHWLAFFLLFSPHLSFLFLLLALGIVSKELL